MRVINQKELERKTTRKPQRRFKASSRDYALLEDITEMAEIRRLAEIESKYRQSW